MSDAPPNHSLKITALSVADAAKVVSKAAGRTITEAMVRADIEAGAPVNSDGTMNMIQYAAWLAKEKADD
jgi:hypothetical protein